MIDWADPELTAWVRVHCDLWTMELADVTAIVEVHEHLRRSHRRVLASTTDPFLVHRLLHPEFT